MTDGAGSGTNGGRRFRFGPWATLALVGFAAALVNATSVIMEARQRGDDMLPVEPFIWEYSSYLLILALAPLIGRAVFMLPPRRDNVPGFVLGHAALTVPFSLAHVAGMVTLRKLTYWAAGAQYDFFDREPWGELFYEWRKDALTYALVATVYWLFMRFGRPPEPARPGDERIEIRDGGAAVFLQPRDILFVEAAGNYVDFHTAARSHLVRGTLAAWEARLARSGFVRVHRSRIANRARISALRPTPSGDVEITLDDGRTLLGSRRYRAALESAPTL